MTISCQIFTERWDLTGRRPVLAHSQPSVTYPATGWRSLLNGVNQMPICGALMPRDLLLRHVLAAPWNYDLSEDYVLFLRVIFGGGIEEIYEVSDVLVGISVRDEGENTVTQTDRRGWTHDIAGHLSDVYRSPFFRHIAWQALLSSPSQDTFRSAVDASAARIRELESVIIRQRWLIERLRKQLCVVSDGGDQ